MRAASAALIRSPVSISRRAWRGPIAASTYGPITAGIRPRRTSVVPKVACALATTMSQQATRPVPPPSAAPLTRATVGLGSSFKVCISPASALASARLSASP